MKKHSDKAAKQHMVLMLSNLKVYSMNVNFHEIHGNVVDPHKLMSLKFSIIRKKPRYVKYFTVTGVWNPCTGQIRWIPFSNRYNTISEFVLGYDNNKTYKILRYSWDLSDPFRRVVEYGIYDFGSHSWKYLDNVTPKYSYIISEGVSLKGNIYWIVVDNTVPYLVLFIFQQRDLERLVFLFRILVLIVVQ
ncbi:unnamed protein product [Brassica oleracea]|nr:unnamed protein product [Brassica napus]VDD46081.1 unnamed protein product [Brassica oleracea]